MQNAEENNNQLLSLLEKYDQKLDELYEQIELKEIEKMQLQDQIDPNAKGTSPVTTKETLNRKIAFLQNTLLKLQEMRAERSLTHSFRSSRQVQVGSGATGQVSSRGVQVSESIEGRKATLEQRQADSTNNIVMT